MLTYGLSEWPQTNYTKQFNGFKTFANAVPKAFKPVPNHFRLCKMTMCGLPQWLQCHFAKQFSGFKTHVNVVLEIAEPMSLYFRFL